MGQNRGFFDILGMMNSSSVAFGIHWRVLVLKLKKDARKRPGPSNCWTQMSSQTADSAKSQNIKKENQTLNQHPNQDHNSPRPHQILSVARSPRRQGAFLKRWKRHRRLPCGGGPTGSSSRAQTECFLGWKRPKQAQTESFTETAMLIHVDSNHCSTSTSTLFDHFCRWKPQRSHVKTMLQTPFRRGGKS